MSHSKDKYGCPLHAVDRRLNDFHRQWHQAEKAYFDPESFRVAIQTAIQTSRTVSFILQSNKAIIPDFDAWYGEWQAKLRAIPLMRWMVDARNQIEKQGDLEAHSWIRAEILASHLDEGPSENIRADLFDGPKRIIESIPRNALGEHIRKDGVLRIERRWVENTLPEYELLDAVAIAYGHLSLMVADAHRQLGLDEPTIMTENGELPYDRAMAGGRMPCMIGHNENRLLDIWLATGEPLELEARVVTVDREKAQEAAQRYGIDRGFGLGDDRSIRNQARAYFKQARILFEHDKFHAFIFVLFKNEKPIEIREARIEEHGQKYVLMRRLANDVIRIGADAILAISEVWIAKADHQNPYRRAVDAPDRQEALSGTLITKDGEPLRLLAMISRTEKEVTLGETIESEDGVEAHYAFAPIYAAWGRPVPGEDATPRERAHARRYRRLVSLGRLRRRLLSSSAISLGERSK